MGGTPIKRGLPRRWLRGPRPAALALLLALVLLMGAWLALPLPVQAWTLPGRSGGASPATSPSAPRGLQEVAPPAAVQQLAESLASRRPRITILEPADGALVPEGPWTLRLAVEDWPLVDAGTLGLGPHLMVQLDDGLPQPLLETTAAMPPLGPGSHRLTVYAVRPWGEVVKAPGAFRQIRLHRVAANPLALPAEGSPQLLAVSPSQAIAAEPVLLDWLLIDAPLQNLRADDARWRLRVTVNGDSFLVNQQTPLWLKGWKPGSNAVLLELVDGRGEPLNPPFNSLVREVRLDPAARRAAWLGPRLSPEDLARLLGELPPEPMTEPVTQTVTPTQEIVAVPPPQPDQPPPVASRGLESPEPAPTEPAPAPEPDPLPGQAQDTGSPSQAPPAAAPLAAPLPAEPPRASFSPQGDRPAQDASSPEVIAAPSPLQIPSLPLQDAPLTTSDEVQAAPPVDSGGPVAEIQLSSEPDPVAPPSQAGKDSVATGAAGRIPSARDEVNADGTLMRPARRSPLLALREKLGR